MPHRHVGAGQRDPRRGREVQLGAGHGEFQRRRVFRIADARVGAAQRRPVGGAAARHAQMRGAGTAQVLHRRQRAGAQDKDHSACTGRNRTRAPGVSSAGRARDKSHSGAAVRPSSRQPPGDSRG